MCLGVARLWGSTGTGAGGGAECPLRSVLAPLPSLPRSFSSMSDITGKGPGTPWGGLIWEPT